MAARAAEDAASQLSTSRQLQLLNLPESSEGKFAAWVGFVTENLFLSLVGVAQREEELEDFTRRMALPDADELVPAKRVKID